jgi:hypothetical protein
LTVHYDRRGRQKGTVQIATTTGFSWNNAAQVLVETNNGGTLSGLAVTNGYDAVLRRTNLTVRASPVLAATAYGYDAASRLPRVTGLDASLANE